MSSSIRQAVSVQSQEAPCAIRRASVETAKPQQATQATPAQISEQDSISLSHDVEEDDTPTPLAAILRQEQPSQGKATTRPASDSDGTRATASETDSSETGSAGSPYVQSSYVQSPYASEGDQFKDMGWLLSHDREGNPLDLKNDPSTLFRSAWVHNRREHNRIEGSDK